MPGHGRFAGPAPARDAAGALARRWRRERVSPRLWLRGTSGFDLETSEYITGVAIVSLYPHQRDKVPS
ncbi:hypothetical protein GCM10018953_46880 [Streptosporangium nondiastaticum]